MPDGVPALLGAGPALPGDAAGRDAWVLEQVHRFCDEQQLAFSAYPMHEVAAHPDATAVLRLFAEHVGAAEFEPLSTTGVPLATREDWHQVLAAAAALGTTTVWVAFHGVGVEHDRVGYGNAGTPCVSCGSHQRSPR
jgi:hypothetical protein